MSEKDNGGPAFPVPINQMANFHGMSLRDWFAGNANEGDILEVIFQNAKAKIGKKITRQQARYIYADAMLAERAK